MADAPKDRDVIATAAQVDNPSYQDNLKVRRDPDGSMWIVDAQGRKVMSGVPADQKALGVTISSGGVVFNGPGNVPRALGYPGFLPVRDVKYTAVTPSSERIVASRLGDGYVYKVFVNTLYRTRDGISWTAIGPCPSTTSLLLPAGDGEVLIGAMSDGVHRTSGWKSGTYTHSRVLFSPDSDFASWGLDVTPDGRCVCTHYRATDYTKSRYVWYSSDCGKTWTVILDINDLDSGQSHLHFAMFDRFAGDRIIVCYHGNDALGYTRKIIQYTDNIGATWVQLSDAWQPTTCVATPAGLVMGTDDAPSGVLHALRKPDGTYGAPYIAAQMPVEQNPTAYQFAIYAEMDMSTGTVYTAFVSQADGTPAGIVASDGVTAMEIYRSGPLKNVEGYREFGILPTGDLIVHCRESVNLGATSDYFLKFAPPMRGALHPTSVDTGRVFGGKLQGSNPFRSVAVGPYSVAGPGTDAVAVGNKAQAGAVDAANPQGTAIGAESVANGAGGFSGGYRATSAASGTSVGGQSVSDVNAVAVGRVAKAGYQCVSVGRLADTSSPTAGNSVAIGYNAKTTHMGSVAIGKDTQSTRTDCVAVGPRDIEITGNGKGLISRSPNGTVYRIVVSDAGVVSASAVV